MTNPIIIFIYLYLGHLIGDMLCQTKHMVKTKGKAFDGIILHCVVVTVVSAACCWVNSSEFWQVYFALFVGHVFIDEVKCKLDQNNTSLPLLVIDQFVHLLFIALLVATAFYQDVYSFELYFRWQYLQPVVNTAVIVGGAILAIQFGSNLVQKAMVKYADMVSSNSGEISILDSEKTMGKLERSISYLLVITGNIYIMALLFVVKLLFRLGQLRQPDQRQQAEYTYISTLMSFGWALAVGLMVRYLI